MKFAASIWKDTNNVRVLWTRIAVEEAIKLLAMSVKVDNKPDISLFSNLLNKCLD
jgi:hypothetical protein